MSSLYHTARGVFALWLMAAPASSSADAVDMPRASTETRLAKVPQPAAWQPSRGRECRNRGKYKRFCAGPRKVAAPQGPAGQLGQKLGLGTRKTAGQLLISSPDPQWVEHAPAAQTNELTWPVDQGKFWRGFGKVQRGPKRKRGHAGIDIGAEEGSPIHAVQSGIVAYADNELTGYGNVLIVVHADGTTALYAHCQAILVFAGQVVERGQIVAQVGHTGIARGTHLHFEYRRRGRPRDPLPMFENPPASALAAMPRRKRSHSSVSSPPTRAHSAAKTTATTERNL